jgi:hypothetical protein
MPKSIEDDDTNLGHPINLDDSEPMWWLIDGAISLEKAREVARRINIFLAERTLLDTSRLNHRMRKRK